MVVDYVTAHDWLTLTHPGVILVHLDARGSNPKVADYLTRGVYHQPFRVETTFAKLTKGSSYVAGNFELHATPRFLPTNLRILEFCGDDLRTPRSSDRGQLRESTPATD